MSMTAWMRLASSSAHCFWLIVVILLGQIFFGHNASDTLKLLSVELLVAW